MNIKISFLIFCLSAVLLYPKHTEKFRILSSIQLNLSVSKNSPALSILEDEKISNLENIYANNEDRENLESGKIADLSILFSRKTTDQDVAGDMQRSELKSVMQGARSLSGLTLKKNSPNIIYLKKNLGVKNPINEINFAGRSDADKKADEILAVDGFNQENLSLNDFMNLAPHLRNRLGEVEDLDQVLNEDYRQANMEKDLAARFEEAVKENQKNASKPAEIITHTSWSPKNEKERQAEKIARKFSRNKVNENSGEQQSDKKIEKDNEEQFGFTDEKSNEELLASRNKKNLGLLDQNIAQATISGQIDLGAGLALTQDAKIKISRKIAGNVVSEGQFKLSEGAYEAYVENPQTGTLQAEMWEGDKKIAQGEILLPELLKKAKTKEDLSKAHITLRSIYEEVQSEVMSAYSSGRKKISIPEVKATLNDVVYMAKQTETRFKKSLLSSAIVVRSQGRGHWGSIAVGSTRQTFVSELLSEETVSAMESILGVRVSRQDEGIIHGQVKIMGEAVEGAEVEIVSNDNYRPAYYNLFLPDAGMSKTSSNGQFVFMGVKAGTYIVRAKYKGKSLAPQVVFVEPNFVSVARFDVEKPVLSEVFVFDIQTSEMVDSKLNFVGIDEFYQIQGGRKLISFTSGQGLQFLDIHPKQDKYLSTRVTVDRSQKEILVPMIPRSWLDELFVRLRTNYLPESGLIVGLSHQVPYMVEMDPAGYNEETKILYFDSQGNWVQGATQTPSGGGFLITNANIGLRSLYVKYQNEDKLKVVTIAAGTEAVNVFNSTY